MPNHVCMTVVGLNEQSGFDVDETSGSLSFAADAALCQRCFLLIFALLHCGHHVKCEMSAHKDNSLDKLCAGRYFSFGLRCRIR